MSYDRYRKFRRNGVIEVVPGIRLSDKISDLFEVYKLNESRLDIISYNYYGDPNYDWLIMMANPEYGSLEYLIPDGATLRIPYPLDDTLREYETKVEKYKRLYK
jgi:hypothetical protein